MAEICFILSSFERGGITRSIIELSKELANYTSLEFAFFENRTSIDNSLIQGTSLQIPAPTYYFQKVFVGVKRYRAMSKYLNREKCKVLICADVSTSLLGWIFSIFHPKLKVIGSCHVGKRLLTFQDRLIIRFIFPRLSDVVVPSENVARELLGIQKRSVIKVIYNMLPLSACENPWPKPDLVEDFFLYFGRFSPEKNPLHFLNMALNDPKTKYVMCGEGPNLEYCKKFARDNNIENISFEGYQPANYVMSRAKLLILPSTTESFGISILEAWIQGIPILASCEAEGFSELASKVNTGTSMPLSRPILEWVTIAHLIANEPLSDDISRKVLDQFHPTSVILDWLKLLDISIHDEK